MSTIAFIPVRGGSKSIPLKNIKPICHKPLVYWVCSALQDSKKIDKIVVATDSIEIKEIINNFNFSKVEIYNRSKENAQDNSSTESVMLEYINKCHLPSNDIFMLVQATNPTLKTVDIDQALTLYKKNRYDSMLSVIEQHFFSWNEKGQATNYNYKKRPRRQELSKTYYENGSFYINRIENIIKHKNRLSGNIGLYEMPNYTLIDIDEKKDWDYAEYVMKKYIINQNYNNPQKIKIKYFFTDCDGTLTDGGYYYSRQGINLLKFNTKDGLGLSELKRYGIRSGIISGNDSNIIKTRINKLDLNYSILNSNNKIYDLQRIVTNFDELAYIGDDINDINILNRAKIKACPADAHPEVKNINDIIILEKKGGEGCVREFIDIILKWYK